MFIAPALKTHWGGWFSSLMAKIETFFNTIWRTQGGQSVCLKTTLKQQKGQKNYRLDFIGSSAVTAFCQGGITAKRSGGRGRGERWRRLRRRGSRKWSSLSSGGGDWGSAETMAPLSLSVSLVHVKPLLSQSYISVREVFILCCCWGKVQRLRGNKQMASFIPNLPFYDQELFKVLQHWPKTRIWASLLVPNRLFYAGAQTHKSRLQEHNYKHRNTERFLLNVAAEIIWASENTKI